MVGNKTTPILFNDFKSEFRELESEMMTAVKRVLKSGQFLLAGETTAFEEELAKALNASHVVAVANGTEAIAIALMASGIKPGDEVILPAVTAYPSIIGIELAGAIPVLCDVDPKTGLLDPALLPDLITSKTAAIMPVHLYGQMCDMKKITKIANTYKVAVIEDCAQSIFAKHNGVQAGGWGKAAAFSFYPTKNLGAYGDAGAVITNDKEVADRAKQLRNYGQANRYHHQSFGFNSRIDELQAAVLRVKLKHVKVWIKRRQRIVELYRQKLFFGKDLHVQAKNEHTYHLYVRKIKGRDLAIELAARNNVPILIHYPKVIHHQTAFRYPVPLQLPHAEKFVNQIISIPVHPYLTIKDVNHISHVLNNLQKASD